jgi:hypothetical protein
LPVLTDPRRSVVRVFTRATSRFFFFFSAPRATPTDGHDDPLGPCFVLVPRRCRYIKYSGLDIPTPIHLSCVRQKTTRFPVRNEKRLHLVGCRTDMFARPVPLKQNPKVSRGVEAPRGRSRRLMSLSCGDVPYRSMTDFGAKRTFRVGLRESVT